MQVDLEKARREAEASPVAWFCVLERARKINDFELAARAVAKLRELGVRVKFSRKAQGAARR